MPASAHSIGPAREGLVEWYDWIVLVLSLGFLAAFGRAVWRDRPRLGPAAPLEPFDPDRPYQVYCRDFDVETDAEALDEALGLTRSSISEKRLAEIEKDLAAWRAHYQSSVLHAAGRIRAATGEETLDDTVVSLLIDHSGSMRVKPMELATKVVLTASALLEALGAKQEVLGFTTVRWKGGRSRERWLTTTWAARSFGSSSSCYARRGWMRRPLILRPDVPCHSRSRRRNKLLRVEAAGPIEASSTIRLQSGS